LDVIHPLSWPPPAVQVKEYSTQPLSSAAFGREPVA